MSIAVVILTTPEHTNVKLDSHDCVRMNDSVHLCVNVQVADTAILDSSK